MQEQTLLPESVLRLAKANTYVTMVTLMPDGRPQAQLTWVDTDGTHILINTPVTTQRASNVRRDPRVSVLLVSSDDPMDRVEVRGRVVDIVLGPVAEKHVDELSRRYLGVPYDQINPAGDARLILKILPERVVLPK